MPEDEIKREDIRMSGLAYHIARFKLLQTRGSTWVAFITVVGVITANIGLFGSYFLQFGISMETMLVCGVIGYFVLTVLMGYIDEYFGIWRKENEYLTISMNDWNKATIAWCESTYKITKTIEDENIINLIKEIHEKVKND